MPFYDYKCVSCGYVFEEFHSVTEDTSFTCPKCKGETKRLISKISVQVLRDAKELGEQIREEARKDAEDIRNGDMEKAADYLGEKGALDFFGEN